MGKFHSLPRTVAIINRFVFSVKKFSLLGCSKNIPPAQAGLPIPIVGTKTISFDLSN
jgi:hypothetical protein